jgi:hypothetical protein
MSQTKGTGRPTGDEAPGEAEAAARRRRDDEVVAAEFSGLDNDLIDMAALADQPAGEDDGLGPADEDEDEPGLPEKEIDETSAGGLHYPDEMPSRV